MYVVQLSIPPNTSAVDPIIEIINISPGIVRTVTVIHPSGCVDLVGVWVEYRTSRLYPTNDGAYFLGNGNPIKFTPNTPLLDPPFELFVKGYNLDDTYTHKPLFMAEIEHVGSFSDRERGILSVLARQANFIPE